MPHEDRRMDCRLIGGGPVEVVTVDEFNGASAALDDAQVLDVSAGGLALATHTQVPAGTRVRVAARRARQWLNQPGDCITRVVHTKREADGMIRLGLQLIQGRIPAALIYRA